ncbi:MAG: transglycosylase domain-containing protein, partial [Clostridia bacterium]|nr:transglycosylase domain-containing protein [Clostridia bacterium]
FGAVLGVAKAYVDGTPALDIDRIEHQSLTSFIYDKNGDLITEYKGLEYRIWAPISEIPKTIQNALIATEDVRFYAHDGLDYKRLAGAFINNLRNEAVQGGSTITQQLIKNTLLSPEQTYKRKIQEAYLSIQLEQEYEKDDILEAYLNTIYLGGGNYGIKAAAENYFGKELHELTLRESAALVGITKNPYRYDLRLNFYSREKPEVSYSRTNLVLRLMYENGFIDKATYEKAKFDDKNPNSPKNEGFVVLEESNHQQLYQHPYFVEYVIGDLITELMNLYGWEGTEGRKQANNLIQSGGLQIYTTMDPEIQTILEDTIYNYDKYPKTDKSKDNVKREKIGDRIVEIEQPQASAVILDHNTGEIKALVGGRSEPQARFWKNRADLAWAAPGSAIKPLSVYAPYIEAGYPGGYIIEDIPVPIKGWDDGEDGKGYPSNYDSKRFNGPITAKWAVTKSYNVSSARTLLERVGIENSMNKLKELGITEEGYVESGYASNLALGSDDIHMVNITAAYGALANKGVYTEPTSISKVYDKNNKLILDNSTRPTMTAFKESTAFIMTDWLEDVVGTSAGTGDRADFKGMSIAGKTGTNDEHRGVFFAGYTPYYTATVSIAHDYHAALEDGSTGGRTAAPLWKVFMERIHENLENKPFYENVPDGVKTVEVCTVSGLLPCKECAETTK